ncbi:protein NRT1/ PTR FAMILY 5.5 [Sesamum angolense]|uniref:Protein NRT1/ PTR FAMILY 5.5 n=1 Tax=Sesamum angolense TaxID=2727404 RepID=A0AAE1W1V6_9LAMI|nr:protein NRT1/ PTR FAMILY 5.5 [Sesamum angolense]
MADSDKLYGFGIFGVLFVDLVVGYIMRTLVTYLSDVWKLSLVHATSIVNIWERPRLSHLPSLLVPSSVLLPSLCYATLPTLFSIPVNGMFTLPGRPGLTRPARGLGLLALSTPAVLGHSTGTCTHSRQPECISTTQRILFYTALPLVAMGMSGVVFMFEYATKDEEDEDKRLTVEKVYSSRLFIIPLTVVGFAYSILKLWSLRFGITAICSAVTIGFLLVLIWCADEPLSSGDEVKGSPLTQLIRVFVASASKVCHKLDGTELYEKPDSPALPRTRWLKCLDKAAIILPDKSREEQEKNSWTLCTVTEVEETKTAILISPLCLSFIICGVVISVGNSYFLEQANHLNPKLGKLKVPSLFLLVLYDLVKSIFSKIKWSSFRVGTSVTIIFSVLCCITAAKVENQRLHTVTTHNLLDRPNDGIPMSLFWMVPQYVLLAVVDSFLEQNVKLFFQLMIPTSSVSYLSLFTRAVTGIGIMGGVLSVFVVGKLSERGGKLNWFQFNLNRSRLYKYYWTLAALSAASLVFYILMSSCYKEPETEEEASSETS